MSESRMASDLFAWFLNVSTSVLIVFVNKVLMDNSWGYRFTFATTLCSLHFICCAIFVHAAQALGLGTPAKLPWKETMIFSVVASVSIASLNLSLLVNSVGFYQISKLLIIPFVCLIEYTWMGKKFTALTTMAIITVVSGVAIVTVTDVAVNKLGLVIAAVSVVTSGSQQILCGTIQRKFKLTSNQLLANTAPMQGAMLLLIGPFIDQRITGTWIGSFEYSLPALQCLALSCTIAVLVNVSQFMCLGKFSTVTFQVLGHTKTVLVLLCGWLYLNDVMTLRKLVGMAVAVVGMVAYGYLTTLKPTTDASLPPKRLESNYELDGKGGGKGDDLTTSLMEAAEEPGGGGNEKGKTTRMGRGL